MKIAQNRVARATLIDRRRSSPVYLNTVSLGAALPAQLPVIVQWSFLLFMFLIHFEVWRLSARSGLLFVASYFVYHNPLFTTRSFAPVPRVMIWFVAYVAVYALNSLLLPTEQFDQAFERVFTFVQVIVFFWIASDILKDEKMSRKALLAYSIPVVILALGLVFSLPGFDVSRDFQSDRTSVMSFNANEFAGMAAVAVVALVGLWVNLAHKRLVEGVWMFGSMFALSVAIVYTGSRGGLVMLMAGLSVYMLPSLKNRSRMSGIIVAVIAMAGLAYIAANTPMFYERWLAYTQEGDTSGRDIIWENALDMLFERPLFGWGPVEFQTELGTRVGAASRYRDAHNTYLHLLTEVGFIGAMPFLIGLGLCVQRAWKARNGKLGLLPLALLAAVLTGSMSATWIYRKTLWFVLALAVAAGGEEKRMGMILVGRRIRNDRQIPLRN